MRLLGMLIAWLLHSALAFAQSKPQPRDAWGQLEVRVVDVTLDGAYVNGTGWQITPLQAGFGANGRIVYAFLPEVQGYSLEIGAFNADGSIQMRAYQNSAGSAPNAELATNAAGINGKIPRIVFLGYGNG